MRNYLRRYTELPFLLHLLRSRRLTLLSPRSWDDRNDAYYIEAYREQMGLASVLALCLTEASETYHHWRIFSGGTSGICIEFNRERLLAWAAGVPGLRAEPVRYRKLPEVRAAAPALEELPFIKRHPFRDEREFRLVLADDAALALKDLELDLATISKIVINPWLPRTVSDSIKAQIQTIEGCQRMRVQRTTLVDNEEWKRICKAGRTQTA